MKSVIVALCLIPLAACQNTRTIIEYKDVIQIPPAAFLAECKLPFHQGPTTYGEAVIRDQIWLNAFRQCACKLEKNRNFYSYSNKENHCEALNGK